MPTTRLKNTLYRLALPLRAPRLERNPALTARGQHLYTYAKYCRLLRKHHVLGSAALLREGDRRVTLYCSSQRPEHFVNPNSLFRVASITKMATALAALRAVQAGKFSLDETICAQLPGLENQPELEGVTLRHLLSHTSGLRDPANLESALENGVPLTEVLPGCRTGEAGEGFRYSNLGFGLVGCLLEAAYDQPVSQVMTELVFSPLDMRATLDASALDPADIVPISRVLPYHPERELRVTPLGAIPLEHPDPLRHFGHTAGAMYTDLDSLEKLVLCLSRQGAPLLSEALGREMLTQHASYGKLSPTLSYGLGMLMIQDTSLSPHRILGHQGFAYGCADGAFWEEETGRMVLFLNGGASEARRGRLGRCNYDVLRWALQKEFAKW